MPKTDSSDSLFRKLVAPLASLKLTVPLLALSMLLVYAGTGAQKAMSIVEVQKRFFHSFYVWVDLDTLILYARHIPLRFVIPGGYTLGVLLLANLLAAHLVRFKTGWKRIGVWLIHAGLILLLVGEGITSGLAVESQMVIEDGAASNYTSDNRRVELAVIDPSAPDHDQVTTISDARLADSREIADTRLPFQITVDAYYANSKLLGPAQAAQVTPKPLQATAGEAGPLTVIEQPRVVGTADNEHDAASTYVTLHNGTQELGRYLVSQFLRPQTVRVGNAVYSLELRQKRYYKPYTIKLKKFTHDVYTGTDMAMNYASEIELIDPSHNEDRAVKISMNHPLRYDQETFYQASFIKNENGTDAGTILMVVDNPAWQLPYIACALGALGMVIHFVMQLVKFLGREQKRRAARDAELEIVDEPSRASASSFTLQPRSRWTADRIVPMAAALLCICYIVALIPAPTRAGPDLGAFGKIPISFEGRVQPLDTLARNSLKILSNRDTCIALDKKVRHPAIEWLIDTFSQRDPALDYKVFRIDYPDLVGLLNLDSRETLFSIHDLAPRKDTLFEQLDRLRTVDSNKYTNYQSALADLGHKIELYSQLEEMGSLHFVPPGSVDNKDWETLNNAMGSKGPASASRPVPASVAQFMDILAAYETGHAEDFNRKVMEYRNSIRNTSDSLAGASDRVDAEAFYNRLDPFLQCSVLYVLAFLIAGISWIGWLPLARAAFVVLAISLVLHTWGLADRIYISHRPPVTNLASSALFIGWGVCILCIGLELVYRNGIATALAALIGFVTLMISRQLSVDGDNMKVLVAVLDTNFWLSTHVPCVAMGYAATFLAGSFGIRYVIFGLCTNELREDQGKTLMRMTYGVVCFAMLFSFVGTILGGIWADQSWGRFWGWDPKENGAVLVVLCNALLLHARWGGLVKDRGFALLAIFGNIVTAWSWFGTNMMGVGLHSYGFMPKAFLALVLFMALQVVLILVGALIPTRAWMSFRSQE